MVDPHARRDDAFEELQAAIASGDLAAVQVRSTAWARAFEDANVAGLTRPVDLLHWTEHEAAQVVANLSEAFLAGPDVTDCLVRCAVGLSWPGRGALSRPLDIRQLVSSAWTSAVQRGVADGSGLAWCTTDAGRTTVAAMAESLCTMHPGYDIDLRAALREAPAAEGLVALEDVLVEVDRTPDTGDLVLSFALRSGASPPGVSWWPAPAEHVIGWPPPLPDVPPEIAASLGVSAVDVYDDADFCPAPLLPIGHAPRALPDLEAIDAVARDHGTEAVSVLGTLSAGGVQLVIRTLGPTAVFAPRPGIVNLTSVQPSA